MTKRKNRKLKVGRKERKISDENFLLILRANAGLYSQTARAIEEQFKIKYTRQAVKQRAELPQFKDLLNDIEEENIDIAEGGLHELINCENERIKLDAIKLYLNSKGKKRGYFEKQEHNITQLPQPTYIDIPNE